MATSEKGQERSYIIRPLRYVGLAVAYPRARLILAILLVAAPQKHERSPLLIPP